MADPKRMKRAAQRNGLICAIAVSLAMTAPALGAVSFTVETSDGVLGGDLTLTVSVGRGVVDPILAGAQTDVLFDTTQIQIIGACSNGGTACQGSVDCGTDGTCELPCTADARLTQQGLSATVPVSVRPPDPAGHRRLRLGVFADAGHPGATFSAGKLVSCIFKVRPDAAPGVLSLSTDRLKVFDNTDGEVPGVEVHVVPGTISQPPPTATVTPTPIPCFVDRDCPLGDVCDPVSKTCKPAPTPTPTIACPDGICPPGLTCVDGICRDLSTPTPTPTPLPTCTTDDDCVRLEGPGFHCRAGVCVPIRECSDLDPVLDRTNCRGVRETCVRGACECGGDCNLDGFVLGNETTVMVSLIHEDDISRCPAGDFNGDGTIMGNEVCQAVTNLGLGCPAEGQPLIISQDLTGEVRSLDIGSASGLPGDQVTIAIGLGGIGDLRVATAQMDLLFDSAVLAIPDAATACAVDPRLQATNASFTFLPQTPNTPPGKVRLRLFVGDLDLCKDGLTFPVGSFTQGPLLSCTFHINSDAPAGVSQLTAERLNIGDPRGDEFGTATTAGSVTVIGPATATPTATNTGATATPTATGATPTSTPTITGTPPTATATPTATNTGPTATATNTQPPTQTPTRTNTLPGGTPTATRTNTTVPPRTNTPTPTATVGGARPSGGGGGGCAIVGVDVAQNGGLVFLAVPAVLLMWRRRSRC